MSSHLTGWCQGLDSSRCASHYGYATRHLKKESISPLVLDLADVVYTCFLVIAESLRDVLQNQMEYFRAFSLLQLYLF